MKTLFRTFAMACALAVAGTATPMVALMDATLLIGGGLKGVIGR